MTTDPVMAEIFAVKPLIASGDHEEARRRFGDLWLRVENDGELMHTVALAHCMADVQDDPAEALVWDMRAFDAALKCTDADFARHSPAKLPAFMPSLHVNLGWDYFKLSDVLRSQEHVALARSFIHELADDAYGRTIRASIERLAGDLAARGQGAAASSAGTPGSR
jgi:hypothetical protein